MGQDVLGLNLRPAQLTSNTMLGRGGAGADTWAPPVSRVSISRWVCRHLGPTSHFSALVLVSRFSLMCGAG